MLKLMVIRVLRKHSRKIIHKKLVENPNLLKEVILGTLA